VITSGETRHYLSVIWDLVPCVTNSGKGEITLMSNPRISIEIILACYGTISTNRRPKKPKRKTQESAGEITSQQ